MITVGVNIFCERQFEKACNNRNLKLFSSFKFSVRVNDIPKILHGIEVLEVINPDKHKLESYKNKILRELKNNSKSPTYLSLIKRINK